MVTHLSWRASPCAQTVFPKERFLAHFSACRPGACPKKTDLEFFLLMVLIRVPFAWAVIRPVLALLSG